TPNLIWTRTRFSATPSGKLSGPPPQLGQPLPVSTLGLTLHSFSRARVLKMLRDKSQEDPRDVQAAEYDINYIGLTGNIGCLVNGAGLGTHPSAILTPHGACADDYL